MSDTILLLGFERKAGLALARLVTRMGWRPRADTWSAFHPRAYRRERPLLIVADIDAEKTANVKTLTDTVRKYWGDAYPIIASSASGSFARAAGLLDDGASDFLPKNAPSALAERKLARHLSELAAPDIDELTEEIPSGFLELFADNPSLVRLGDVADIYAGVAPRRPWSRRMAPPDDGWRGVATASSLARFHIGRPETYLLWSRLHLFRMPAAEEYSVPEKVLLSRAGPPLIAAVDRSRLPAGADTYSIVPRGSINAGLIACVLNSRLMDFYCNRLASGADGRIRPETLRDLPFPKPRAETLQEANRLAALLSHFGPDPESWVDKRSKEELLEQMDNAVFACYGAGDALRASLAALHF